ncbi:MAG TPA: hypothetical protein VFM10_04465, partial [Terriglobales bacterium]|nr:hypothetical protein [Terriglobales bacterium]
LRTKWGFVLNVPYMVTLLWSRLLRAPILQDGLPVSAAWISILAVCGLCLLLLNKRIQARQVVRG